MIEGIEGTTVVPRGIFDVCARIAVFDPKPNFAAELATSTQAGRRGRSLRTYSRSITRTVRGYRTHSRRNHGACVCQVGRATRAWPVACGLRGAAIARRAELRAVCELPIVGVAAAVRHAWF